MALSEKVFISAFAIERNNCISVRKTTQIEKDGAIVASSYHRWVLTPNDPQADEVLDEPFYLDLARYAWTKQSPETYTNDHPALPQTPTQQEQS